MFSRISKSVAFSLRPACASASAAKNASSTLPQTRALATARRKGLTRNGGTGSHSKNYIFKHLTPWHVKAARKKRQEEWSANPRPLIFTREMKESGELPFAVHRTELAGQLPVYVDYKNGRNKVTTILRKIEGDVPALATEFQKVCLEEEVKIYNGRIEARGNHTRAVKKWLESLGF